MSFNYKAIFVDLDGTLLNSQKKISPRNLKCLNDFISQGVKVIVSTGRTIKSVKAVTEGLNLSAPIITLNGNDIRRDISDDYPMLLSFIDNNLRDAIFNMLRQYLNQGTNNPVQNILVDTSKGFYCLHPNLLDSNEFASHYDSDVMQLDLDNPPVDSVVSFLILLSPDNDRELFLASQSSFFQEKYNAKFCTFNGWPWIEIGSPNVNKGTAMHIVCKYLGINIKDVIAFGDGENDVEMLEQAGLGVAMANADIHALKIAKAKALSNDEDGVSVFLERLKLAGNI
ncbi:Cof-type HAD-IIB family hydrolase [Pigmentibacter sp. JX0631]|uniref:Cof-type HAD-IIB family hydrolase n=1 Tax=Pigmentibacter sp. JX0631 TaxID=2976982 RepID=UPI00246915C3|nr:Cof-type HAD-IIB family hydrolase [Pigmentibacter sp. JX0631]WGL61085.1 Cof-type HAD-IIB family hydrolase [Pigmentibacter sp. JX0631]